MKKQNDVVRHDLGIGDDCLWDERCSHSVEITEIYSHTRFGKYFVKTTFLLRKLAKNWFNGLDGIFFDEMRVNFPVFSTM